MGKGIGILTDAGYAYKIVSPPETLQESGVLNFDGFKGDTGDDIYQLWLDQGNVGTVDDFFSDIAGLISNDVRTAFATEKDSTVKQSIYSGDDLVSTTYTINSVVKYTATYNNLPDGNIEWRRVTRNGDGHWFQDNYEYDGDGVLNNIIPSEGI